MPGFSAKEVEERATRPMEKLLWEIPGVEYIYSTSRPGESLAIVRFKVGEDVERSLVKLNQKLQSNFDRIPHGVSSPLIKPKSIDDVPILALTFHSAATTISLCGGSFSAGGRRGEAVPLVAETTIIGGAKAVTWQCLIRSGWPRAISAREIVPMLLQTTRQNASPA
jgi:Cu/Ag efflux pump CusA